MTHWLLAHPCDASVLKGFLRGLLGPPSPTCSGATECKPVKQMNVGNWVVAMMYRWQPAAVPGDDWSAWWECYITGAGCVQARQLLQETWWVGLLHLLATASVLGLDRYRAGTGYPTLSATAISIPIPIPGCTIFLYWKCDFVLGIDVCVSVRGICVKIWYRLETGASQIGDKPYRWQVNSVTSNRWQVSVSSVTVIIYWQTTFSDATSHVCLYTSQNLL